MRKLLAIYRENKDLIDVGMYQAGQNHMLDIAIQMMPKINKFLQQGLKEAINMDNTINTLKQMMMNVDV